MLDATPAVHRRTCCGHCSSLLLVCAQQRSLQEVQLMLHTLVLVTDSPAAAHGVASGQGALA